MKRRRRPRKAAFGALLASEERERLFTQTDALFHRLWVQVVNNPEFPNERTRAQVAQTYRAEWLPFKAALGGTLDGLDQAGSERLERLFGRATRALGGALGGEPDPVDKEYIEVDALFERLWKEVGNNPNFKDTPMCNKTQVAQTYREEWLPFKKSWQDAWWHSTDEEAQLNAHGTRANGWALSCLPGFTTDKQAKGVSVDDAHKTAAWVDINAPGGGPPPPGTGILGVKKSSLVLGGLLLIGTATAVRIIFH